MTTKVFNSVLCPVDFGDSSIEGLRYAAALANCQGAHLMVLHAHRFVPPPYFTESQMAELEKQHQNCKAAAKERLEKVIATIMESTTVVTEVRVIDATPVEGILQTASTMRADLIVIGTHGRGGFDRLMLGSVTERILRLARIPVLAVRPDLPKTEVPIRHVLCPVNDTPLSSRSLELATNIAQCFGASLTVLHIRKTRQSHPIGDLHAWLAAPERSRGPVREATGEGNVAQEIISFASESGCDLIVVGAHHRRFLDIPVLGTTTERVVRHGPCPVLVAPADGAKLV